MVNNFATVRSHCNPGDQWPRPGALTNWLCIGLRAQGTQVVGVHPGPVETGMARELTLPKITPGDVVRQALDAVEAGRDEFLADELTRSVKAGLSAEPGIYLDFMKSATATEL